MHPLKFIEASKIRYVQLENVTLGSRACQQCLTTFQDNMRLVGGMFAAPSWSAFIILQWAEAGTLSAIEFFKDKENYNEKLERATPEERKQHFDLANEKLSELVEAAQPDFPCRLEIMTKNLEQIIPHCGEYIHGMFHGILKSVCVQAWTALEVLFEDLHTEAIDQHPAKFASVDRSKPFQFRRTSAFREAYQRAFSSESSIMTPLRDQSIDSIANVRHLLVHKAGKADDQFLKAAGRHASLAHFANLVEGQTLALDGEMVRALVDPAVSQAYILIVAVDKWLAS